MKEMKKLIHKIFVAVILISICSWMGGCVKDSYPEPDNKSEDALIYLRLTTPGGFSNSASRALTFEQENTINDIYVLVFNSANSLIAIKQGEQVSSTPGSGNPAYSGEGSFTLTLSASRSGSDTYKLVVLANAATLIANTIGTDETTSTYVGKSYSEIVTAIYGAISGKMYNGATDNAIPMWGESNAMVVQSGINNETLQLTRAVARIDIGVGVGTRDDNTHIWSWSGKNISNEEIPFRLGHVYVMRPNNQYTVIPNPGVMEDDIPSIPAGTAAFSIEDSESLFAYSATASATGGFISQEIYVPESDIFMGTAGTVGDANHTNRMAIVVGGYYNGSATETFYRLDFAVNNVLINVVRNHLYQFSISKVTGAGFSDVETAYESQSMNMTVRIYDWDAIDMMELFLDGSEYVMLGQSKNVPNDNRVMTLPRSAGSKDSIEMRTNIPLDKFVLALNNGGAFPDAADPTIIQNNRFKVELKSEAGTNYFVITALQSYDAAAADNPSVLTITAERITFVITIRQIDYDLGDWKDGGNIDKVLGANKNL